MEKKIDRKEIARVLEILKAASSPLSQIELIVASGISDSIQLTQVLSILRHSKSIKIRIEHLSGGKVLCRHEYIGPVDAQPSSGQCISGDSFAAGLSKLFENVHKGITKKIETGELAKRVVSGEDSSTDRNAPDKSPEPSAQTDLASRLAPSQTPEAAMQSPINVTKTEPLERVKTMSPEGERFEPIEFIELPRIDRREPLLSGLNDHGLDDLLNRYRQGEKRPIAILVGYCDKEVTTLAKRVAGKYMSPLADDNDLAQIGRMAISKAMTGFKGSTVRAFWAYASRIMCHDMHDYANQHRHVIVVPQHFRRSMKKAAKAESSLTGRLNRQPTREEIMNHAELTADALNEIDLFDLRFGQALSIDEPVTSDFDGLMLLDIVADAESQPHEPAEIEEAKELQGMLRFVWSLLEKLAPQEFRVLELRLGLRKENKNTLAQVGQLMNLTAARISQIEKSAIDRLKTLAKQAKS